MSDSAASHHKSILRVIKLGGSLLGDAKNPQRISDWLTSQSNPSAGRDSSHPIQDRNIWIVGGGELVNTVRQWDAKFMLNAKLTHWTCIDLMDVNSRLLSAWFPEWPILDCYQDKEKPLNEPNQILLTGHWLRGANADLPESWATTSDSIAAAFAGFVQADELVLLKSCDIPESISLEALGDSDIVDDQFVRQVNASFQSETAIRLVNLLSRSFRESIVFTP